VIDATNARADRIGHEIRTLSSAVVGLTDLLRGDSRDPRSLRRLGQLHDAVLELVDAVDHLLEMSSPPNGEPIPAPEAARVCAPPDRASRSPDLRGLRVLLAEDHPLSQEIFCDMLEPMGCEVLIAADGAEVLDMFRARAHDLILMDVRMPGVDGLEATRRIRALPAGSAVPIIGLSASASAEDRKRCLDVGMNEHIAKPLDPQRLRQVLCRWASSMPRSVSSSALGERGGDAPHDESGDAALLAAMTALPGIRLPASWRDSTPRLRTYQALLVRFVQTQVAVNAQMRLHLENGRAEAASSAAHSLAGAAGMVGARSIMELARAVELALRQGRAPRELLAICARCETEMVALAAALEQLPRPVPAQDEVTPR